MNDVNQLRDANPWQPMTLSIDLKLLGKLGEECNELGSAVCRCIIQGIAEREPVTGKPNREWLEDEIGDVIANINLVTQHFGLDTARIAKRVIRKTEHLRAWHSLPEATA
jgi:NTP pyrophosphatase (non-canonical NTP hydrolase)